MNHVFFNRLYLHLDMLLIIFHSSALIEDIANVPLAIYILIQRIH